MRENFDQKADMEKSRESRQPFFLSELMTTEVRIRKNEGRNKNRERKQTHLYVGRNKNREKKQTHQNEERNKNRERKQV
jgi:hypothetical protein